MNWYIVSRRSMRVLNQAGSDGRCVMVANYPVVTDSLTLYLAEIRKFRVLREDEERYNSFSSGISGWKLVNSSQL
jgi:hypothetical protein